jgi:hypothetical protein
LFCLFLIIRARIARVNMLSIAPIAIGPPVLTVPLLLSITIGDLGVLTWTDALIDIHVIVLTLHVSIITLL